MNLFKSPHLERALAQTDVGDLWYVGPAYERMLKENGINNALEFRNAPEHWVRAKMTVVGARIQSELKGIPCLPLELLPPPKKMVGTAQGFGALIEIPGGTEGGRGDQGLRGGLEAPEGEAMREGTDRLDSDQPFRP